MRRIWGVWVPRSEVCKDGVLTGVKQIPETSSTSTIEKNDAMKRLYKRDIFAQLQYYIFFMIKVNLVLLCFHDSHLAAFGL